MAVQVRIPTVFRKYTGGSPAVAAEPGTVANLIDQLDERFPGLKTQLMSGDGNLHKFVNVYVNDEDARYLDQLETEVTEGDTVSLLPSVAGGS